VVDRYADTIRRVCFLHLRNSADAEDVFQEVFLKYVLFDERFNGDDHEKAWLIRVAVNLCRDLLRFNKRRGVWSLSEADAAGIAVSDRDGEVLDAVLRLPDKYRDVIYLFYYEGYSAVEIAKTLNKRENTIYTWMARARRLLRGSLGGDGLD
jgi:RNA polymerase sigma-70 factor (ECF subfamily)